MIRAELSVYNNKTNKWERKEITFLDVFQFEKILERNARGVKVISLTATDVEFLSTDDLNDFARKYNIHPVCLLCKHSCKSQYSFWSFQMPPDIFCEDFEEAHT